MANRFNIDLSLTGSRDPKQQKWTYSIVANPRGVLARCHRLNQTSSEGIATVADNDLEKIIHLVQTTGKIEKLSASEDFYDAGFSSINALQLLLEPRGRVRRDDSRRRVRRPRGRASALEALVSRLAQGTPMTRRISIKLAAPANDMVQEEIIKQVAFLSVDLRNPAFSAVWRHVGMRSSSEQVDELTPQIHALAKRVQASLRRLERKVVFSNLDAAKFDGSQPDELPGVHFLGLGQAALDGTALRLFRYFDRAFEALGHDVGG